MRGQELLAWIESRAEQFGRECPERGEVRYHGGWSPRGFRWWLDRKDFRGERAQENLPRMASEI